MSHLEIQEPEAKGLQAKVAEVRGPQAKAAEATQAEANDQRRAAWPAARTHCPDCKAELVVLRVIGGRADCEYWTMRCTRCGGIHLDIVKTDSC
jgi:DNA-directed RNA polymerase subunit M/transcription elongation factor TFIIS